MTGRHRTIIKEMVKKLLQNDQQAFLDSL